MGLVVDDMRFGIWAWEYGAWDVYDNVYDLLDLVVLFIDHDLMMHAVLAFGLDGSRVSGLAGILGDS
jgi:hypothetical protein